MTTLTNEIPCPCCNLDHSDPAVITGHGPKWNPATHPFVVTFTIPSNQYGLYGWTTRTRHFKSIGAAGDFIRDFPGKEKAVKVHRWEGRERHTVAAGKTRIGVLRQLDSLTSAYVPSANDPVTVITADPLIPDAEPMEIPIRFSGLVQALTKLKLAEREAVAYDCYGEVIGEALDGAKRFEEPDLQRWLFWWTP